MPAKDLLALQCEALEELRSRGVLRSANKATGDFAEYLFCKAYGWMQRNNSHAGYDALDSDGRRYQIKSRQLIKNAASERQLGAIRNFERGDFDFLAAVLFDKHFSVFRAAIIPYTTLVKLAPKYSSHTNSHTFFLKDAVWDVDTVIDATPALKGAAEKI